MAATFLPESHRQLPHMNFSSLSAFIFILLGGLIALLNGMTIYRRCRTGRFSSTVPILGALFLGMGLYLMPKTRPYAWMALFLDPGTVSLLVSLPKVAREFWSTSRFNLEREYEGRSGPWHVRLRLFRKGIFTLRVDRDKADRQEAGLISAGITGTWRMEKERLILLSEGQDAVFERMPDARPESYRLAEGLASWREGQGLPLAGVVLALK